MKKFGLLILLVGLLVPVQTKAQDSTKLLLELLKKQYAGKLTTNPYVSDSVSNPYGIYGSKFSGSSIWNQYGTYGSPVSPYSWNNPYTTSAPKIFGSDGKYLGRLSSNPYDPDSISNPYGRYGSPYSPDSIRNPYGNYGSKFSPNSWNNPYATKPPVLFGDDGF